MLMLFLFLALKCLQLPPGAACLLLNSDLPKHILQQNGAGVTACLDGFGPSLMEAGFMLYAQSTTPERSVISHQRII